MPLAGSSAQNTRLTLAWLCVRVTGTSTSTSPMGSGGAEASEEAVKRMRRLEKPWSRRGWRWHKRSAPNTCKHSSPGKHFTTVYASGISGIYVKQAKYRAEGRSVYHTHAYTGTMISLDKMSARLIHIKMPRKCFVFIKGQSDKSKETTFISGLKSPSGAYLTSRTVCQVCTVAVVDRCSSSLFTGSFQAFWSFFFSDLDINTLKQAGWLRVKMLMGFYRLKPLLSCQ